MAEQRVPDYHPRICVRLHSDSGIIPAYESSHASGCDLRAAISAPLSLEPLARILVPTGLRIEIPAGYEAQVRPRSGKAYKKGLSMPNTPGTIDADYRGEVKVVCINLSNETIEIEPGERIAQLVIAPVVQADFQLVDAADILTTSQRQEGGFGSTGH